MTDRAVAKLQALVRIPTVSDRDWSRVDTDAFDRLLAELRTPVPAAARAARADPGRQPRPAVPLARREQRTAGRPDGAPRRRTGRRVGTLAAPALLRRDRRRRGLGSRHPRRQGLRRGDLRGGRAAARGRPPSGAGRLALLRLRRGGLRSDRPGRRRRAGTTRRAAVARARRGRCGRARRVPRGEAARRRDRRGREGHHQRRAPGRGTRRPRLDPGPQRTDRPSRPGDRQDRPVPDGRPAPGHHRRPDAHPRSAPPPALATGARPGRPDPAPAHPRAHRRRTRGRRDGAHDVRGHHARAGARRST